MARVFLGLGSNVGNRAQYLSEARKAIREEVGEIEAVSSIYESEAVGFEGDPFYNQVIKVRTMLNPENLLIKTQEIEKMIGRTEKTVFQNNKPTYKNRVIDIDILLYDDLQINTKTLTIPHSGMWEREFVMKPLNEMRKSK